jgi:hypothetical protein
MLHHTTANHVQFDIAQALPQILSTLCQRGMKVISPESNRAAFAMIVSARKLTRGFLHQTTDLLASWRIDQQMHVIGSQTIIQQANIKLRQCLPEFFSVGIAITRELQQERAVMTAMRNMKEDAAVIMPSMGSRHDPRE